MEKETEISPSTLSLHGFHSSTCGYCGPPGKRSSDYSSYSFGIVAENLTCQDYQAMIDRGWRRSGDYCYKPDMRRTCCPQYTIRLDAFQFTPTKKQRKVCQRWTRFVLKDVGGTMDNDGLVAATTGDNQQSQPTKLPPFSLLESIHNPEASFLHESVSPVHKFEVILEPSSYSDEKFSLYQKYQQTVHKETREHSPKGFMNFLVDSPLQISEIEYTAEPPSHLPKSYGSYHQLYRLDGKLIAMAVLDILPSCVSSVYFMYDDDYEKFSLGKLSALREASLAREIHEHGAPGMRFLYMGYYIHSCQKMRYKADYSPSYLLDPEEYSWVPLKDCIPALDKNRYACFTHPEHNLVQGSTTPSEEEPRAMTTDELKETRVFIRGHGAVPINETNIPGNSYLEKLFAQAIAGFGSELSKRVIFSL